MGYFPKWGWEQGPQMMVPRAGLEEKEHEAQGQGYVSARPSTHSRLRPGEPSVCHGTCLSPHSSGKLHFACFLCLLFQLDWLSESHPKDAL